MKRVITALAALMILIPVCVFSYPSDHWPSFLSLLWPLIFTALSVIGVYEMLKCVGVLHEKVLSIPSFIFSVLPGVASLLFRYWEDPRFAFAASVFEELNEPYRVMYLAGGLYFIVMLVVSVISHNRIPSEKLFATIAFVFYVTYSFTAMTLLRDLKDAGYYFPLVFLGAWGSDTFAFCGGKLFGKHKLCPSISPKKTVEGAISGVIGNVAIFLIYAWIIDKNFVTIRYWGFILIGILLAVIGQFGDLFTSCIKRHYGVKDYGIIFPGHGGVLDRFDSVLAIADVFYLVFALFGTNILIK